MKYIANLLRKILVTARQIPGITWLFFPALLFLFFAAEIFWYLDQGQDLFITAFEKRGGWTIVLLAEIFWLVILYQSSVYVSLAKAAQQKNNTGFFKLPVSWISYFPKLAGFVFLLIAETALLRLPIDGIPVADYYFSTEFFLLGILVSWRADILLKKHRSRIDKYYKKILLASALIILVIISVDLIVNDKQYQLQVFFSCLIIIHFLFLFILRIRMLPVSEDEITLTRKTWRRFLVFNGVLLFAIFIYCLLVTHIGFSLSAGALIISILGLALINGFANLISFFSIRTGFNLHLVIFILALLGDPGESHYVRILKPETAGNANLFQDRQDLQEYITRWINKRGAEIDSAKDTYPVYFVLSNGGASRSGYWTSTLLGELEDSTSGSFNQFSRHLFSLSGASGGGAGVASFFSMLYYNQHHSLRGSGHFQGLASRYWSHDLLSYPLGYMFGPDYFRYIFHLPTKTDRAVALEQSFETAAMDSFPDLKVPMSDGFSGMVSRSGEDYTLPLLFINTTEMQNGSAAIISNIKISDYIFAGRMDVLDILSRNEDIRLSTAAVLGARFPYISPAGRIDGVINAGDSGMVTAGGFDYKYSDYFVDGGYFDNSGAGTVQEEIQYILAEARSQTIDTVLSRRLKKLNFYVLHIDNAPMKSDYRFLPEVSSIKNDLVAPVYTLLRSYNSQTELNDTRLKNLISLINNESYPPKAFYYPLHLSNDFSNDADSGNNNYVMSWSLSRASRASIDKRLKNLDDLARLLKFMRTEIREN